MAKSTTQTSSQEEKKKIVTVKSESQGSQTEETKQEDTTITTSLKGKGKGLGAPKGTSKKKSTSSSSKKDKHGDESTNQVISAIFNGIKKENLKMAGFVKSIGEKFLREFTSKFQQNQLSEEEFGFISNYMWKLHTDGVKGTSYNGSESKSSHKSDSATVKVKRGGKKPSDPNAPKKPISNYILFSNHMTNIRKEDGSYNIFPEGSSPFKTNAKVIGKLWEDVKKDPEEFAKWNKRAQEAKVEYQEKKEAYENKKKLDGESGESIVEEPVVKQKAKKSTTSKSDSSTTVSKESTTAKGVSATKKKPEPAKKTVPSKPQQGQQGSKGPKKGPSVKLPDYPKKDEDEMEEGEDEEYFNDSNEE
jgi:hypothetical protein